MTRVCTNTYVIFSLWLFGDYNLDGAVNSNDYSAASNLPGYGWGLPVESNTLHKVELRSGVLIDGHKILSLNGSTLNFFGMFVAMVHWYRKSLIG